MNLKQLIEYLEKKDCDLVVPIGFDEPHSYRGDYMCLAFEPARDVTVGAMLQCARDAIGSIYEGSNGGEYRMVGGTEVYLAAYGCSGEKIGTVLLDYMTGVYDSEECEHLRGVINRSTDEIAGLIAKIDEKNRLIVNDRDTLRSIERICVELEMCNPKAVSRDVKAIKSMKRISNIMEEWDPNIGREEESKSWWKNGYAIISAAIDRDEVIKKQNQTILTINAEIEAAKQYNPFDLVLMAGSIENMSRVIEGQTEPFIDDGCVESCKVCARSCKVVDIAAGLQEELESTRNMYQSSSDECCKQRRTIGDLRAELFDLKNSIPDNFWVVITEKDFMIRRQGKIIEDFKTIETRETDRLCGIIDEKNVVVDRLYKTIDELKDRNAEDLNELYTIDKAELSSMKHNYEIILQNRCDRGDKLEDNIKGLEAELSARKQDSVALKKVVGIVKNWGDLSVVDRYSTSTVVAMRRLYSVVKDHTAALEDIEVR